MTYNIGYDVHAYASLGGAPNLGGSASANASLRNHKVSAGPIARGTTTVQDTPDPDTDTLHRVFSFAPSWHAYIDGSGYWASKDTEEVIAEASASYNSGSPAPPPGMQGPMVEDDGSYAAAFEAISSFRVSLTGV